PRDRRQARPLHRRLHRRRRAGQGAVRREAAARAPGRARRPAGGARAGPPGRAGRGVRRGRPAGRRHDLPGVRAEQRDMTPPLVLAGGAAAALVIAWLLVALGRAGRASRESELGAQARDALTRLADRALELETVHDILASAREAVWRLFGSQRVVAFEPGGDRGAWEVFVPGGEPLA